MQALGWVLAVMALIGATGRSANAQAADRNPPLIVCSTTQTADFARQIVGDRFRVVSILAAGEDPHLYKVVPRDARLVADATLCIRNGWNLEGNQWMEKLAANAGKPLVTCVEGIAPLELEEAEGHRVKDPHAWFSPRNAAVYVRNIQLGLAQVAPQHRDEFAARSELYANQLRVLHAWIQKHVNQIPVEKRVLVTSHDAFNYFCQAYRFRSAAPVGWSTGAEVGGGLTAARRQETVKSIRSFGVPAIFVETSVNEKMIKQIAEDAGVSIGGKLYSDSMGPPESAGETYLGMMRENVLTIVRGLKD